MNANKDTARECLARARKFLAAGDHARAQKFAAKSQSLFPTEAAKDLLNTIATRAKEPTAAAPRPAAAAAAEAGPADVRRSTAETPPERNGRQPTQVQTDDVNRVLRLGEDNLYEKLGVARDADAVAIKKAFRKLSFKLHPDRNPHPKADAAFKAINKANEILGDERQRRVYDMTGQVNQGQQPGGGGGRGFGNVQQVDPDELIRMMFGGGFRGPGRGGFHFHTTGFGPGFHQRRRQQHPNAPQNGANAGGLGDGGNGLLWMVIMLLSIQFLFPGNSTPQQHFKLDRDGSYMYPMKMVSRAIPDHNIKFFVTTSVGKQLATAGGRSYGAQQMREALVQIERDVEKAYWTQQRSRCQRASARGKPSKSCGLVDRYEEALWAKQVSSNGRKKQSRRGV
mmetsp:Transcript_6680/g.19811  ORF Transcript_6680/g.19811 Transcript_6680/m.19811 type:complete len:396 (-) Transcript_6680:953-2140(-)